MTLNEVIDQLLVVDTANKANGKKSVIMYVEGMPFPLPDVTGVSVNEDTVVINAKVFESKP